MICVGSYASALVDDPEEASRIEEQLDAINSVLRTRGFSDYIEPREIGKLNDRSMFDSFSYATLMQLRDCYMDFTLNQKPYSTFEEVSEESHLVCHSDYNGFYLPIDFNEIIADENRVPGTWLGSSYQLMRELIYMAPALQVSLEYGCISDKAIEELNYRASYGDELIAWVALFEAARLSIEHRTAIIFR